MGTGEGEQTLIFTGNKNKPPKPSGGGNGSNKNDTAASGSGGYGVGGGGGADEKQAADNLAAVTGFNFQTPKNVYDNTNKVLDTSNEGNKNIADWTIRNDRQQATNDWYKQRQDLQSVVSHLSDSSGNMFYGSGLEDFMDLYARKDDQNNVETLNTEKKNEASVMQDYYEALQANINASNTAAIDSEESMRNVAADYVAQLNNIKPDLAKDYIDSDNKNLNLPDWLNVNFVEDRLEGPVNPEMLDFIRPSMDAQTATNKKLVDRVPITANASSTNQSYWQRLRNGYNRRNQ